MTRSVIVAGARTPIGKFGGGFRDVPAVELGARAIREALSRADVQGDQIDYVIMGQVIQAGTGQITARQAAIGAEIPREVPAITINKVCLSGLNAVALADQLIRAGEIEVAVAGGFESMSGAPYLIPAARWGVRMGNAEIVDSMIYDGLWSTFTDKHMGESSDEVNAELGIGREEQDAWAARSHIRAAAAWDQGRMAEETFPVQIPQRKGDPVVVDRDEGIRPDTSLEKLAGLRAVFEDEAIGRRFPEIRWVVTAGNASQITDGASSVLVMAEDRAEALGLTPRAHITHFAVTGDDPIYMLTGVIPATAQVLERAGLTVDDIDVFEVNEAFASVVLAWQAETGADPERVNPRGGAIAFGHPVGASGGRLMASGANALEETGGRRALVVMCESGGMANATLLERPA